MKLTVIGACGRTGKLVCQEAASRGHQVTALSRNKCQDKGVDFVIGDAADYAKTYRAVRGAQAVISVVGHNKIKEGYTQTAAVKQVVKAMQQDGCRRLVSLTGTGVRAAGDTVSAVDWMLNQPLKLADKDRIQDGIEHYKFLKSSDIDWTILRVLKLNSQDKLQNYSLTSGGPAKLTVSRRTVAKILVDLAESNDWLLQLPVVSK